MVVSAPDPTDAAADGPLRVRLYYSMCVCGGGGGGGGNQCICPPPPPPPPPPCSHLAAIAVVAAGRDVVLLFYLDLRGLLKAFLLMNISGI